MSAYQLHGYYINLDERGEFYADVRDQSGETVFEFRMGPDCEDSNPIEDGYMRHKEDVRGLTDYLRDLGIIPPRAVVLSMPEFESVLDEIKRPRDPGAFAPGP